MSMQLPELSFNVRRQTPFKNIRDKRLNWLKQLGVTYDLQARNSVQNLPDTLLGDILFRWRDSIDLRVREGADTVLVRRPGSSFYQMVHSIAHLQYF